MHQDLHSARRTSVVLCIHTDGQVVYLSTWFGQENQISVLHVLALSFFPDSWQNEDLYGFADIQQLWKAMATVTTYSHDDSISVKSHEFLHWTTRDYCKMVKFGFSSEMYSWKSSV